MAQTNQILELGINGMQLGLLSLTELNALMHFLTPKVRGCPYSSVLMGLIWLKYSDAQMWTRSKNSIKGLEIKLRLPAAVIRTSAEPNRGFVKPAERNGPAPDQHTHTQTVGLHTSHLSGQFSGSAPCHWLHHLTEITD